MRLVIEIVAAALLVLAIGSTGAAFAAGKAGRSADGLSCSFSVRPTHRPRRAVLRSAAVRRKFAANYCGDKMLSAM